MKIDFEFTTQHGVFRDALYLDDDHAFSIEEINALKQERLDNWMATVNGAVNLNNEQHLNG